MINALVLYLVEANTCYLRSILTLSNRFFYNQKLSPSKGPFSENSPPVLATMFDLKRAIYKVNYAVLLNHHLFVEHNLVIEPICLGLELVYNLNFTLEVDRLENGPTFIKFK